LTKFKKDRDKGKCRGFKNVVILTNQNYNKEKINIVHNAKDRKRILK
jgi:hypothetical protein